MNFQYLVKKTHLTLFKVEKIDYNNNKSKQNRDVRVYLYFII